MILRWLKDLRRKKLISKAPPEGLIETLKKEMPLFNHLNTDDQKELIDHVKVLLHEKHFVGAHGLSVSDEMRFLICGQAAVLLLHRKTDYFPNVSKIVIYESAFASIVDENIGGNVYLQKYQPRVGESNYKTGTVVLSWMSTFKGAQNPSDGHNVVLHEFAHQLDSETGSTNGAPPLSSNTAYRAWAEEMSKDFFQLQNQVEESRKTFIDQYGATSPAEFFAVVTEAFFEKPIGLRKKHPELYKILSDFYLQDPARYFTLK